MLFDIVCEYYPVNICLRLLKDVYPDLACVFVPSILIWLYKFGHVLIVVSAGFKDEGFYSLRGYRKSAFSIGGLFMFWKDLF